MLKRLAMISALMIIGVTNAETAAMNILHKHGTQAERICHSRRTVQFSLPFKTRPIVVCGKNLSVKTDDISPDKLTFSGEGQGYYEIIGE